jgi:hypothetical protein
MEKPAQSLKKATTRAKSRKKMLEFLNAPPGIMPGGAFWFNHNINTDFALRLINFPMFITKPNWPDPYETKQSIPPTAIGAE